MITIDKGTLELRGILAANVTTQPMANVVFSDQDPQGAITKYGSKQTSYNHSTYVIVCASPPQNFVRNIESLQIYNADSATVTHRLFMYDTALSTSTMAFANMALLTTEVFGYENGFGFYSMTSTGARK